MNRRSMLCKLAASVCGLILSPWTRNEPEIANAFVVGHVLTPEEIDMYHRNRAVPPYWRLTFWSKEMR